MYYIRATVHLAFRPSRQAGHIHNILRFCTPRPQEERCCRLVLSGSGSGSGGIVTSPGGPSLLYMYLLRTVPEITVFSSDKCELVGRSLHTSLYRSIGKFQKRNPILEDFATAGAYIQCYYLGT